MLTISKVLNAVLINQLAQMQKKQNKAIKNKPAKSSGTKIATT
jgi:hypothetical protein